MMMMTTTSRRRRQRKRQKIIQSGAASANWSDLPNDLLSLICNRLHPSVDLPRIRAVCKSWRLSIHPAPNMPIPMFPDNNFWLLNTYFIEESTLYRFKYDNSKSFQGGGEFIARISASQPSKFFILSPSYGYDKIQKTQKFPKGFNFLDCTVSESKTKYKVHSNGGTSKAAYSIEFSTVLFTYAATLVFIRAGGRWTKVGRASYFLGSSDITLYNGNFYAINYTGIIEIIDPLTMKIIRTVTLPDNSFIKKKFVQSRDDLYVLDQGHTRRKTSRDGYVEKKVDFKIYRLNEYDCTWVYVKTMRNQVLVMSHGSYSCPCWIFGKFHLLYG